jgi:hypothetical protein
MILATGGTPTGAIWPTARLSGGPATTTRAWAMCEKIAELFLQSARRQFAGSKLMENDFECFNFTVHVGPQFTQSATDAPKTGLF